MSTIQVRFQVVNQPTGRPDSDSIRTYPANTPIYTMFTASHSAPGSVIQQTEGLYIRTWTLLEDPS